MQYNYLHKISPSPFIKYELEFKDSLSNVSIGKTQDVQLSNDLLMKTYKNLKGFYSGIHSNFPGSGYIDDPILRIDSNANNEIRGKDLRPILILLINHIEHGVRTIVENNRFNRKGNTFNDGAKRWNFNSTFDQLGSRQIQSTTTTNINKYNVNSFIQRSVI